MVPITVLRARLSRLAQPDGSHCRSAFASFSPFSPCVRGGPHRCLCARSSRLAHTNRLDMSWLARLSRLARASGTLVGSHVQFLLPCVWILMLCSWFAQDVCCARRVTCALSFPNPGETLSHPYARREERAWEAPDAHFSPLAQGGGSPSLLRAPAFLVLRKPANSCRFVWYVLLT